MVLMLLFRLQALIRGAQTKSTTSKNRENVEKKPSPSLRLGEGEVWARKAVLDVVSASDLHLIQHPTGCQPRGTISSMDLTTVLHFRYEGLLDLTLALSPPFLVGFHPQKPLPFPGREYYT